MERRATIPDGRVRQGEDFIVDRVKARSDFCYLIHGN